MNLFLFCCIYSFALFLDPTCNWITWVLSLSYSPSTVPSGLPKWWRRSRTCLPTRWDMWDVGSTPGWGRSPGEGHGDPLQYPSLRIPRTEESDGLQSTGSQSRTQQSNSARTRTPYPRSISAILNGKVRSFFMAEWYSSVCVCVCIFHVHNIPLCICSIYTILHMYTTGVYIYMYVYVYTTAYTHYMHTICIYIYMYIHTHTLYAYMYTLCALHSMVFYNKINSSSPWALYIFPFVCPLWFLSSVSYSFLSTDCLPPCLYLL